jgi:hypothetical protein
LGGGDLVVLRGQVAGRGGDRSAEREQLALGVSQLLLLGGQLVGDGRGPSLQIRQARLSGGQLVLQRAQLRLDRGALGLEVGQRLLAVGDGSGGAGLLVSDSRQLVLDCLNVGVELLPPRLEGGDGLLRIGDLGGEDVGPGLQRRTLRLEGGDLVGVLAGRRLQDVLLDLAAVR